MPCGSRDHASWTRGRTPGFAVKALGPNDWATRELPRNTVFPFLNFSFFPAVLGLRCFARAFSGCSECELLFLVAHGSSSQRLLWLRSTGSGCAAFGSCGLHALERRLSSCGTRASLLRGMWNLPGPGIEHMSPALADRFLSTAPPGKS